MTDFEMMEQAQPLRKNAMIAAESGNLDEAIRLATASSDIEHHAHTAMRLSKWHSEKGNKLVAILWGGLGHSLKPNHTQVADRFAQECLKQGLIERGMEVFVRSLELNRDHAPSKRLLAEALRLKEECDEASS